MKTDQQIKDIGGHPDAIPAIYLEWFLKGYRKCESDLEDQFQSPKKEEGGQPKWKKHISEKLIAVRDALVVKDIEEAYHQLYQIADPEFVSYTPWAEIVKAAQSPSEDREAVEEDYWKKRCEAAEKVIEISGIVDCEGYDQWQSLKEQNR